MSRMQFIEKSYLIPVNSATPKKVTNKLLKKTRLGW
jgi:hypothetical protein